MQKELDREFPGEVQLLAVNELPYAAFTDQMAALGDIPLLQDTGAVDAWGKWAVTYRDVVVLDGNNERRAVYNLTVHNLDNPAEYAELKSILQALLPGE